MRKDKVIKLQEDIVAENENKIVEEPLEYIG
jgi:hypothetical protein